MASMNAATFDFADAEVIVGASAIADASVTAADALEIVVDASAIAGDASETVVDALVIAEDASAIAEIDYSVAHALATAVNAVAIAVCGEETESMDAEATATYDAAETVANAMATALEKSSGAMVTAERANAAETANVATARVKATLLAALP